MAKGSSFLGLTVGGKLTLPSIDRSSRKTVFGLTRGMLWDKGAYLHNPMSLYGFDLAGAQSAGPPLVPQAQPAIFPSTPHIHLCSNAPVFVQCADASDVQSWHNNGHGRHHVFSTKCCPSWISKSWVSWINESGSLLLTHTRASAAIVNNVC